MRRQADDREWDSTESIWFISRGGVSRFNHDTKTSLITPTNVFWSKKRQHLAVNLPDKSMNSTFEFPRNTQSLQCWYFYIALTLKNQMDFIFSHLNFNSKHHDKCKIALKLIPLVTVSDLFSLKVLPKCQHCQKIAVKRIRSNDLFSWGQNTNHYAI